MGTWTEASVACVWRDKWMDVRIIRYGEKIRKIDTRNTETRGITAVASVVRSVQRWRQERASAHEKPSKFRKTKLLDRLCNFAPQ